MNVQTLALLACPVCHGPLTLEPTTPDAPLDKGILVCPACSRRFPLLNGIPCFIDEETLVGPNRPLAHLYDRISGLYLAGSRLNHALSPLFGSPRNEFVRRLDPNGGCILEVSIGPGTNLPYLFDSGYVDSVVGLDISLGQLEHARRYSDAHHWLVDLVHGQAEALPFADNSFDGVLHIGGINFFTDRKAAIAEMIRVAKPGTHIVIGDENEGMARLYEWTIPGFKASLGRNRPPARAPVEFLPDGLDDVHVDQMWRGAFYCIDFRKPFASVVPHAA